jgi:hypothetical protein
MVQPEMQPLEEPKLDSAHINAVVLSAEADLRRRLRVNVRAYRSAAKLTLKAASQRAEMHWRHWQKVEAGQVNATLQTLVRMAYAVGVDPAALLELPSTPPSVPPREKPEA